MTIGARTVKTGLAVTVSMYLCYLLNIELAIFAAAATVLNLQPSVGLSLYNAKEQLIVHFISIGIAIAFGLTIGSNPLIMGIATIVVILVGNRLGWKSETAGGIMAAIFILGSPASEFLSHALTRSAAIFIGVAVALLINTTIARPNYRKPLLAKMTELNKTVAGYFAEAVQSYLSLSIPEPQEQDKRAAEIGQLFHDTQKLYELYLGDIGSAALSKGNGNGKRKDAGNAALFSGYFTYNKGLWQRTRDILFLAQERKERRQQSGDQPISPEFREILEHLGNALAVFVHYNDSLTRRLQGEAVEPVRELRIWRKLDEIINNWHNRFPAGSYYLHALVEISLLTDKIRWGARESTRLIGQCDTEP